MSSCHQMTFYAKMVFAVVCFVFIQILIQYYYIGKSEPLKIENAAKNWERKNDGLDLRLVTTRTARYANKKPKITYISSYPQMISYMKTRQWPLIVTMSTGRLGNNIHNYALSLVLRQMYPNATYGVSQDVQDFVETILDAESLVLPALSKKLMFADLPSNLTVIAQPRLLIGDVSNYVIPAVRSVMNKKLVLILEGYPLDIFAGYEQFLFNSLRVRRDLKAKALGFLEDVKLNLQRTKNITDAVFIGVHIRRAEYVSFAKEYYQISSLPGKKYFEMAFQYYRRRLTHPVFVVCSDDPSYVSRAFEGQDNIVLRGNRSGEEDMSLLASCSHSVMTVGSFGFWGSFLAGGQVLYAQLLGAKRDPFIDPLKQRNSFQNYLPLREQD